jgi:beta-lactam-binding protein with PASTA domain
MSLPDFLTKEVDEDTAEVEQYEEPESTRKVVPVSSEKKETVAGTAVAGVGAAGAAIAAAEALSGAEQQSLFAEETDLVSDIKKKEEISGPETTINKDSLVTGRELHAGTDASAPVMTREPEIKPVVIPVADKLDVPKPAVTVAAGSKAAGEKPAIAAAGAAAEKPVITVAGQKEDLKPAETAGNRSNKKPKKRFGFLAKLLAVILLLFLMAAGGIVYFFSSSKPDIVVADVNGKPVAEAQKALEAQGFKVELENKVDPSVKPGMVLRMDPVAGMKRKAGATITLVVSGTEKTVAVPKIVGLKQDQAEKLLSDKNLRIEKIEYKWDKTKQEGVILSQTPEENSQLGDNGAVNIVINKKEEKLVVLPDLKGMTLAEAKKKLEDLKLKVEVKEEDSDKNKNTVVGMSPSVNDTITEGTTVVLMVSNAKKQVGFPATPENISNSGSRGNGSVTVSKASGSRYAEFVVPGTGTHMVQIVSNNGRTQKVEVSGSYNGGVRLRTKVDSDVQRVGFYVDHRLVEEKSW